jgi:hypothetical protein
MKYVQLPLVTFLAICPEVLSLMPGLSSLASDREYYVRLCPDTGEFEFGYLDDEWTIK